MLFINLISYIYLDNIFNKDNMNYCKFLKNKFLMKKKKKQVKIAPNIPSKDNKDSYKEYLIRADIKHRSNSVYILYTKEKRKNLNKEKLNTKEKEKE